MRLTEAFPQQALWSLAAVCKSAVPARRQAANSIVNTARQRAAAAAPAPTDGTGSETGPAAGGPSAARVYDQFFALMDQLIRLCHWVPQRQATKASAQQEFERLIKLLPVEVMVPVQAAFNSPMPPVPQPGGGAGGTGARGGGGGAGKGGQQQQQQGVGAGAGGGQQMVMIAGLEDSITIMSSLQVRGATSCEGC